MLSALIIGQRNSRTSIMTKPPNPLLLNLAKRLRLARKCLHRGKRENCPKEIVAELQGAMLEAWNSFQAAKQIV